MKANPSATKKWAHENRIVQPVEAVFVFAENRGALYTAATFLP